jgi:hypothetical protein
MSSTVEQIEHFLNGLSNDELLHVLDIIYEKLEDSDGRIQLLRSGETIDIELKRNHFHHSYLGVSDHLDFFPEDVLEDDDCKPSRNLLFRLEGVNGEHEAHIYSRRQGRLTLPQEIWQEFLNINELKPKSHVEIERRTPYSYWILKK